MTAPSAVLTAEPYRGSVDFLRGSSSPVATVGRAAEPIPERWESPLARIMIVEGQDGPTDEPRMFAAALRADGYKVDVVTGASECLARLDDPPSLVLLNTLQPGMPWTQFCRQLQVRADIPIVIAARIDSEIDAVLAFELGVVGYLSEPSRTRELVARVRAALRTAPMPPERSLGNLARAGKAPESVVAGPLEIDLVARDVTLRGASVYLARREFDLLSLLMSPPGIVRTREELMEAVWEGRALKSSRTLDTHIRRLRMKLEADPDQPKLITTVRGVGFMFEG